jgi:hypothetical protein
MGINAGGKNKDGSERQPEEKNFAFLLNLFCFGQNN